MDHDRIVLPPDPTPLSDPHGYLALRKFSRKIKCRRTGLNVSFADVGDPDGVPLLVIPPSGCSRWLAAPQEPIAKMNRVRIIIVDRPGVGAVPSVPLEDRISTSCQLIESVIEYLELKIAHLLASSAGIYCALHLLLYHPSVFICSLNPPPSVYLIAPWSPPLPKTDPLTYTQRLDWIPTSLLSNQHYFLPYINPAAQSLETLITSTSATLSSVWSSTNRYFWPPPTDMGGLQEPETPKRIWAADAKYLFVDYVYAEEFRGIGEEHLICLNRGPVDTGPEWFEAAVSGLVGSLRIQGSILNIKVWWGANDAMVPRNGQLWLNKTLEVPGAIELEIHDIPDGDHTNLMSRSVGIGEVYRQVREAGAYPRPGAVVDIGICIA